MPEVETPADFDTSVLKHARKGAMSHWWGIAVIAIFLAVIGTVTQLHDDASVISVSRVPQSPLPTVDLYALPPVPVVEDDRFEAAGSRTRTVREAPVPYGVAGH